MLQVKDRPLIEEWAKYNRVHGAGGLFASSSGGGLTPAQTDLNNHLSAMVTIRQGQKPEGWKHGSAEELIQKEGQVFSNKPFTPSELKTVEAAAGASGSCKGKQCYYNSWRGATAGVPGVSYAEGVALRPRLGIPIDHAWLVVGNKPVDFTWRNEGGIRGGGSPKQLVKRAQINLAENAYAGVKIPTNYIMKQAVQTGQSGPYIYGLIKGGLASAGKSFDDETKELTDLLNDPEFWAEQRKIILDGVTPIFQELLMGGMEHAMAMLTTEKKKEFLENDEKFNPYHDRSGRFGSHGGAANPADFHEMKHDREALAWSKREVKQAELDRDQVVALGRYQAVGNENINGYLRGQNKHLSEMDKGAMAQLDGAIAKSTISQGVVTYRGIPPKMVSGLKPGQLVSDEGFVSTSLSKGTSQKFGTVVQVRVPKGSHALAVEGVFGESWEQELLLPRGSVFKVDGTSGGTQILDYVGTAAGKAIKEFTVEDVVEATPKTRDINRFIWKDGDTKISETAEKYNRHHGAGGRFAEGPPSGGVFIKPGGGISSGRVPKNEGYDVGGSWQTSAEPIAGKLPDHLIKQSETGKWLADSEIKDVTSHCCSEKGANRLMEDGVDFTRQRNAALGTGFYTARIPDHSYGPAEVKVAIKAKNFISTEKRYKEVEVATKASWKKESTTFEDHFRATALSMGHNGVRLDTGGTSGDYWLVAFRPQDIRFVVPG